MTRTRFGPLAARLALFCAVSALSPGAPAYGQASPRGAQPNIVVILADDLGFSDLGSYGGEIPTPNLDRLAADGLRFTQFYNTARCSPTRASLLTGLYPHQAGLGHMPDGYAARNREIFASPAYSDHLNPRTPTIAEALRGAGYATYMSGKWHLGYQRPNWPIDRGFDRSFVLVQGAMNFYGHGPQGAGVIGYPQMLVNDQPFQPGEGFFATDAFSDSAVGYIRGHDRSRPFFLYLAYTAPHWPLHAPASDVARFRDRYREGWDVTRAARHRRLTGAGIIDAATRAAPRPPRVPPWDSVPAAERARWERDMEVYAAQVERMDTGIGRVLQALSETGAADNTLVVFLSDNGGAAENPNRSLPGAVVGERDSFVGYDIRGAHVSSAPFRQTKKFTHEGGIATPLIVRWPARIRDGGTLRHDAGHLIDLFPTFLEVAGATTPMRPGGSAPLAPEGLSLVGVFGTARLPERALFWEHEGNRAVREGRWKLVSRYPGDWELYDLAADRTELHDLAGSHGDRVRRLASLYADWSHRVGVKPWSLVAPPEVRR